MVNLLLVAGAASVISLVEHHTSMSFEEDYLKFLRAHNVKYDERFVSVNIPAATSPRIEPPEPRIPPKA